MYREGSGRRGVVSRQAVNSDHNEEFEGANPPM